MSQDFSDVGRSIGGCGCTLFWLVLIVGGGFFLYNQVCNRGTSEQEYLIQIAPVADRYNSSRDVVDETVQAIDSVTTATEAMYVGQRSVTELESAILDMNEAYREFGNLEVPEKYWEHQTHTLAAWRSGIEATVSVKLYVEGLLLQEFNESLVIEANRLFREEDMHQLEARRSLAENR